MKRIWFATKNEHKLEEARAILADSDIQRLDAAKIEIRSEDLREIAESAARSIQEGHHIPFFVEDSGLFVDSLNGFPGPYSSGIFKLIGIEGLLKLMENIKERSATFESAIVFFSPATGFDAFEGKAKGEIALTPRGEEGFDYDPAFIPADGAGRTYAEMGAEAKNTLSHRARALAGLKKFIDGLGE